MTKEVKTQWHPAFCSAVKLELIENKADLDYSNEYNLNSKPIQIDLLVIKKSKDVDDISLEDITITLVREGKPEMAYVVKQ